MDEKGTQIDGMKKVFLDEFFSASRFD